jgi:methyltransferase
MAFPDSRILYSVLVAGVALMRLAELNLSRRNIARLSGRGAVEVGNSLYPWMVAVHSVFLVSCVAEVWLLDRPPIPLLSTIMLALLVVASGVRWWVITTLGERWSTRIVFVPGEPPVTEGPFRWIRHPNYLAVVIEFVALPLVHTAWLTAMAFSLANAAVLSCRIRSEEAALEEASNYLDAMGDRPRFHPGRK